MHQCLLQWLTAWRQTPGAAGEGEVVAIDGKTLRRTIDRGRDLGALHLVSAWAKVNGISLGASGLGRNLFFRQTAEHAGNAASLRGPNGPE